MTELKNKFPEIEFIKKEETVSTNADARALYSDSRKTTVIIADRQTGGRGRQGKSFHSPEGGLYMTVAIPCGLPLSESVGVTSSTAVCVARAIEKSCGAECGIKWVNDIYLGGGKLGGILVESINDYERMLSRFLIIGIGINLVEAPCITDSTVSAACLKNSGFHADRFMLCGEITDEILKMRDLRFDFSHYADEYRNRSVVIGHDVTFTKNGVSRCGTAENITSTGGLTVRCGGEIITLDSGEIHLRVN